MTERNEEAVEIVRDCQAILAEHLADQTSDPKETISKLLEILDGPRGLKVGTRLRVKVRRFEGGERGR